MRRWMTLPLMGLLTCSFAPAGATSPCTEASLARTRVTEVYPTGAELPANLLRLYVYFTRPMERSDPAAHVTLRDAQGMVIEGALLTTRSGLWSADSTRLTVLLNPGRVKTGLAAHERLGPVLESGHAYTLHVARSLPDANGCALGETYEKAFRAEAADRTPPTPEHWHLTLPPTQTRQPLSVTLRGSADHVSLAYRIRILDGQQRAVSGAIDLAQHEQVWRFTPARAWQAGTYTLGVDPRLEDLAGNRPTGLFDDPTGANRERSERAKTFHRDFVLSE